MNTPKSARKNPGAPTPLSARKARQSTASRASTSSKNSSSIQKNPRLSRFLRSSQVKGDHADTDTNISLSVLADFDADQLSTNITAQEDQTMDLADDSVMDESLIKIDNDAANSELSQIEELLDKRGLSEKTIVFSNGNDSMDITSQYKPAAKTEQSVNTDQNMSIDMDLTTEISNEIPTSSQKQAQSNGRLSVRRSPRASVSKKHEGNAYSEAELDTLAAKRTTPRKSMARKEPMSARKSARLSVASSFGSPKSAIRSTFKKPEPRYSHASAKSSAKQGRLSVGEDTYEIKTASTTQKPVEESTGDWLNTRSARLSQFDIDSILQQTSWDNYEDTHSIQDDMSMDISMAADASEEPVKDSTGNYPTASTDELQGALEQIEQVRSKIVEERKAQDPLKTPTKTPSFVSRANKTPSSIRKSFVAPDSTQAALSRRSLLFSTPRRSRMPSLKGMIADVGSKVPILASTSKKVDQKARRSSMVLQQQQQQQQGKVMLDLNTSTNKWVDELMNEAADETVDFNKSPRLSKAIENIAYAMSPRSKKRRESLSELKPDMPFARSPVAARGLSLSKFLSVIRSSLPSLEEQKKAAMELITPDEKEKQDFALLEIPSIRNTAEEFLAIKLKTTKDALESLKQRTEILRKETEVLEVTFDQRSKKEGSALASYLQALSEDTETVSRLFKQSSMRAFEEGMRLATSINDVVDTEADHLCEKLNADLITARQRLNVLRKERIRAEESLAEQISFRSAKEIIMQLLQSFKDVKRRSTIPRSVKSGEVLGDELSADEQAKQDIFNKSLFLQAMTPWKIVYVGDTYARLMFVEQFILDLSFELLVEEQPKRRRVTRKSSASSDAESHLTVRLVIHDALFSPNKDVMIEPYFVHTVHHNEIQRNLNSAKQKGKLDVQLAHLTTFLMKLRRSMKEIAIVRKTLPVAIVEKKEGMLRDDKMSRQPMRMTLRPKELPVEQSPTDVIIKITFSNVFPLNRIAVGLVYHVGPRIEFYDLKVTRGSIKEETIKELVASHSDSLCNLCSAIVKCVETSSNKTLFGKVETRSVADDVKME